MGTYVIFKKIMDGKKSKRVQISLICDQKALNYHTLNFINIFKYSWNIKTFNFSDISDTKELIDILVSNIF